jgi:serine/threonine protein kinase
MVGTPAFMAPELHMRQKYDPCAADVWSMGVILYIIVTGKMPFAAAKREELS